CRACAAAWSQPCGPSVLCDRSGYSLYSVMAFDFLYRLKLAFVVDAGTMWSLPPAIRSRGGRSLLWKFTAVGEFGLKLATLAWKRTWSGPGTAYRSYAFFDSS